MKMDLARQKEELERREKALRQRESSHRNFLQMLELMKYNNVVEWNEECVCAWIQHFLMGASTYTRNVHVTDAWFSRGDDDRERGQAHDLRTPVRDQRLALAQGHGARSGDARHRASRCPAGNLRKDR